ncbi:hypothetical protein BO71DRAFT_478110 [Aspergillus ellipticus CBS 707.79]|uniref:Integral membrane protein n=1 Tax=Aspergillus ellipticus CBS 707.79 TaxID=1448320 RepID=A0A319DHQ6_9EURO|nr:hypothetical protein BO71DRAFT_478110 [Aspergillus ellipticus CBS 707.79]
MSTPVEQLFLYGQVLEPEFLDVLGYLDLTAGAAGAFAAVILFAIVGVFWKTLAFGIFTGARQLISLVRALCRDGVKDPIGSCQLSRLVSAVVSWYFPFNHPTVTICRLWGTCVGATGAYFAILLPGFHHLSGLAGGLGSGGWSEMEYCFDVRQYDPDRWVRRQWLEDVRCNGVKTGMELRALIEDSLNLLRDDDDICHLHILAFVAVGVLFVFVTAYLPTALARTVNVFWERVDKVLLQAHSRVVRTTADDETRLQVGPPSQEMAVLSAKVDTCEALLEEQRRLLTAKSEELVAAKQRMEEAQEHVKRLTARRIVAKDSRHETVMTSLRQDLAKTEGQLILVRARLKVAEDNAIAREQALEDRIAHLELQLTREKDQAEANSLSEIQSFRAELQARNDQLAAIELRLAAADHSVAHNQDLAAHNQDLAAQNQEYFAQNQALVVQNEVYVDLDQELTADSLVTIQQERDEALGRVFVLQHELGLAQSNVENGAREAKESLARAHETEEVLRQSMRYLKDACDMSLEDEREVAAGARKRVSDLEEEVGSLQSRIGMAMRDAQRSYEQAMQAKEANKVLEHRLAKFEGSSSQQVPKHRTGDLGWIKTALEQSQVKVSEQQTFINELETRLGALKQGATGSSEQALRENVQKLREALDKEKRQRMEDQIRWDKRVRELEEEARKLRISASNAGSALVRRRH